MSFYHGLNNLGFFIGFIRSRTIDVTEAKTNYYAAMNTRHNMSTNQGQTERRLSHHYI